MPERDLNVARSLVPTSWQLLPPFTMASVVSTLVPVARQIRALARDPRSRLESADAVQALTLQVISGVESVTLREILTEARHARHDSIVGARASTLAADREQRHLRQLTGMELIARSSPKRVGKPDFADRLALLPRFERAAVRTECAAAFKVSVGTMPIVSTRDLRLLRRIIREAEERVRAHELSKPATYIEGRPRGRQNHRSRVSSVRIEA